MKLIPLTQSKFAKVDDEDYDFLMQWKWHYFIGKNGHEYAVRATYIKGKKGIVLMHRIVMKVFDKKEPDHIDHNGLNNQKDNLRIATKAQNLAYRKSAKNSTSKYLGVSWHKKKSSWCAQISINGKTKYLGKFKSEQDAAKAYDEAAKVQHKEFANLNFK